MSDTTQTQSYSKIVNADDLPHASHENTETSTDSPKFRCRIEDAIDPEDIKPWKCGEPYQHEVPRKSEDQPWEKCHKYVRKYDEDMIDGWRDEVEHLLIFAGLFSAIVTAFAVESYKDLQQDPGETMTQLLQISQQLAGTNISAALSANPAFAPSPLAVRINVLYFLSLTFSLGAVLIGILCLQWLRQYNRDAALSHKDAIALRQMRYEGLLAWRVPEILSSLPVILQIALVLFFAGLLCLLWSLDHVVALLVTVSAGFAFFFLVVTTVSPSVQYIFARKDLYIPQCPYKSPQSWAFHRFVTWIAYAFGKLGLRHKGLAKMTGHRFGKLQKSFNHDGWTDYDLHWRERRESRDLGKYRDHDAARGLGWIDSMFSQSLDAVCLVYHCLRDLPPQSVGCNIIQEDMVKGSFSDDEKKEIISAFFLETHRQVHPNLVSYHLEAIIRVANSAKILPFKYWPVHHIHSLPEDVITQFLLSIKSLVSNDRVSVEKFGLICDLVRLVILRFKERNRDTNSNSDEDTKGSIDGMLDIDSYTIHRRHLQLACGIIQELATWSIKRSDSKHAPPIYRLQQCTRYVLDLYDVLAGAEIQEHFDANAVVRELNGTIQEWGGISKVFEGAGAELFSVPARWSELARRV